MGQQVVVGADGVQAAIVQNDDHIGALHRADALGDDEFGHIGQFRQGVADAGLGRGIHGAGGIVKDKNFGMFEQRAGDAKALFLPAGNIDAALAQVGIQPVGHTAQKFLGVGRPAGRPQFFVGGVGAAPLQIIADGAGEQQVFLQHDAHGVPQGRQVIVPHIAPADPDGALGGVVQAGDQLDQRCLGRAGAADDAHGGPCRDMQRDIGQGVFLGLGVIFEADVVEVHGAVGDDGGRVFGVGEVRLFGQHLADTAGAGQRAGHLQEHAGEHHDRVEDLQHIAEEGGQVADAHGTVEDEGAAEPHDAQDGRVHDRLESGGIEHGVAEGLGAGVAQFAVDGVELFIFPVAAHERLDGADAGEGFLDAAVQMVDGALLAAVQRRHAADDPAQHQGQDGGGDHEHERQARAEDESHAQPHAEHDGAADQRAQAGVDGVEQHGGVGGHAGDERRAGEAVQVGEVEFFHRRVFGAAQFRREAVGVPCREPRVQQAGDERQHRAQRHQPALVQDDAHILRGHALVDQGGHQHGDHHFKPALHHDQGHGGDQVPMVWFAVTEDQPKILHLFPPSCPFLKERTKELLSKIAYSCDFIAENFKSVPIDGHVPAMGTHTGKFTPKLCARSYATSARFWGKFCRRGFQRGETGASGASRARLLPLLKRQRLVGIWLATMAANISPQPASSAGVRVWPSNSQPASALNTLSRHIARLAMVGSSAFWPTICNV